MAVGKSAGRVSIRVYPDTTKFRADTRKGVDAALAGFHPILELSLQVSEKDKRAVKEEIDRLSGDRTVDLHANVNRKLATVQLARISRNRFVDLVVRVTKGSVAKVAATIAALSGGRAVANMLQSLGESLANLDKNLPRIAAIGLAVANIGAAALASVGGLVTLGAGLVQVMGLLAALPAVIGGGIVGAVTLGVAISAVGDRLKSLVPGFKRFQKAIGGAFWRQATGPIKEMVNTLLPRFQAGMSDVAFQLGDFTAKLAGALQKGFTKSAIATMMANLGHAIALASRALQPLVTAFTMLGVAGSRYLPSIANTFDNLSNRFASFVERITSDGSLERWVSNGVTALRQIGSVVSSVVSILSGLFDAANAPGSASGLANFASVLARIAEVVNSPGFQRAMSTIFAGAAAGVSALSSAIAPLGGMFSALAGTIATVMTTAGQAVGGLLSQIATALSSPAFQNGLTTFFFGIQAGLTAIGPALPAVVTALGMLGQVAGTLAGQIGSVLAAALQVLAPALTTLLTALQPLIPLLGQTLVDAITTLAPSFTELVTAIAQGLVPAVIALVPLIVQMVPLFVAILEAIVPLVPVVFQLVTALLQFQTMMNSGLTPAIGVFAGALQAASAVVQIALATITSLITGNFNALPGIVTAAGQRFVAAIDRMTGGAYSRFVEFVIRMVASVAGWLLGMYLRVVSGWTNIRLAINTALQAIATVMTTGWNRLVTAAQAGVARLVTSVRTLPERARAALGNIGSVLYSAGADLVRGFLNGMSSMIGAIAGKAAAMAHSALAAAKGALGIGSPSKVFNKEVGQMIPAGIMVGVDQRKRALNKQIADLVQVPSIAHLASAPLDSQSMSRPAGGSGGLTFSGNTFNGIDINAIADAVLRKIDERQALEPMYGF